jgi:hypothetical protein
MRVCEASLPLVGLLSHRPGAEQRVETIILERAAGGREAGREGGERAALLGQTAEQ